MKSNEKNNQSIKKRILKRLGQSGMALVSVALMTSGANALEPTPIGAEVLGNEGGKEALNEALKLARKKPALAVAGTITCLACLPAAGAAASPGLCIACGILVAKIVG